MPYIRLRDEVDIFYTDEGTGSPILMLHGWACDGTDWCALADHLATDHRVVIPDHRGHGRSSTPHDGYDVRTLAADAAALLRALDVDSATVAGHSLGAVVASVLAVEHPALVDALVLVEPAYGRSDALLRPELAAIRADTHGAAGRIFAASAAPDTPRWIQAWRRRRLAGTPAHVVRDVYLKLFEGPQATGRETVSRPYLARRRCPVLSVYSRDSRSLADWERELLNGRYDEVVKWPEPGHFPHHDAPEHFAVLIGDWLSRLPA